jgi:hypothetical protein
VDGDRPGEQPAMASANRAAVTATATLRIDVA